MRRWILWVPFVLFAGIALTAAYMLKQPSSKDVPSALVGKELPAFALPAALPNRPAIDRADYGRGEPRMLNVFASWCIPCIQEAPQLEALARQGVPIDAVAIRDRPEDIARFLGRWGDPYRNIGLDTNVSLQLSIGSAGVPETFIIDGRGNIRHQHIGPIAEADVPRLLAEFEKARR